MTVSELWLHLTPLQLVLIVTGVGAAGYIAFSLVKARGSRLVAASKPIRSAPSPSAAPPRRAEAAPQPIASLRDDITILRAADKGEQRQSTRSKIAPKLLYASTVQRPEATVRVGISTSECEAVTSALRQKGCEATAIPKAQVVIATIAIGSLIDIAKLPGVSYIEETVLDQSSIQ